MDAIIKIKQKIEALESGIPQEDIEVLQHLLSDIDIGFFNTAEAETIVKMMQSITKYLAGKKQHAHGDALPLLGTLCTDLEKLVGTPDLTPQEARNILNQALASFRDLKTAISQPQLVSKADFEELQAVILAVDWEISNDTLDSLDKVISRLEEKLKSDKVQFTFLRIMHSIGAYIARKGADADKDEITLLQSVFQGFEKLFMDPDMPIPDKKALVDDTIAQYNEFKHSIVSKGAIATTRSSLSEDELPPALSHVGGASVPEGEATLSVLSETSNSDNHITPALSGVKKTPEPQRDVMGDLFSPKTSPADELLDAIHMAELHGSSPQPPPDLMGLAPGQEEGEEIKNYTPERVEQDPIPEIGSRLDEFFNLDVSEDSIPEVIIEDDLLADAYSSELTMAPDGDAEDDEFVQPGLAGFVSPDDVPQGQFGTDDGIETLDEEDTDDDIRDDNDVEDLIPALNFASKGAESGDGEEFPLQVLSDDVDEMMPTDDVEMNFQSSEFDAASMMSANGDDASCDELMARLSNVLNVPEGLKDAVMYAQTLADIASLNQLWMETDQTKVQLLDLLTGLIQYINADVTNQDISFKSVMNDLPEQNGTFDENELPSSLEQGEDVASAEDQWPSGEETENTRSEKGGFWTKVKGLFRK